jgi:Fe-S cluster assembly protein SufD
MLIGDQAAANAYPYIRSQQPLASVEHEASTCRMSEDQLFYLQSRGLSADTARSLLIDAFSAEILAKIPLESLRQRLGQCVACRSVE